VASALRDLGEVVTDASVRETVSELRRNSTGAGPLDALLAEPGVSDVLVNGPKEVFVDRGEGLERADVTFVDDEQVRRLAIRLAAAAGRRLDDAAPFVDGRLPDGTRLHAVSLRVPARRSFALEGLVSAGSLPPDGADILRALVARRVPFLVSGGTGTGKSTLLSALLALVPAEERIVLVEDARELRPAHPHCVRLEGRPANGEGAGAIALTTLVRQALRMRPDRVVLGEVRGGELTDLLTALNTGHEGGCGTVHANSLADIPARLEALAALGGLGREACHAQVAAALKAVIHVRREPGGARRVAGVGVFRRGGDGLVEVVPAVTFAGDGVCRDRAAARLDELVSP
jgi:pilus assembly protein CpaF